MGQPSLLIDTSLVWIFLATSEVIEIFKSRHFLKSHSDLNGKRYKFFNVEGDSIGFCFSRAFPIITLYLAKLM